MNNPPCPSVADIAAISAQSDPVLRNLQITQAYQELSAALALHTGRSANWCTFATWASKQVGHTLRGEELARKLDADFGTEGSLTGAISRLREFVHSIDAEYEPDRIRAAIREVYSPVEALRRTKDAIAHGNKRVFEEIGLEFARFLVVLRGPVRDAAQLESSIRAAAGPLELAFAAYARTLRETDAKVKAELTLLANLRIAIHEQTGLQPDIAEALNAPVPQPRELKERLLDALVRRAGPLARIRLEAARRLGRTTLVEEAAGELAESLRRHLRRVITEELITLELPAGHVHPSEDVREIFPDTLRTISNAELRDLLAQIDPTPDSPRDSAARDWADLHERMHFITDLFRAKQGDVSLFEPAYTPAQVEAIKAGRIPAGPL
jgi:hypothetical protein